MPSTTSTTRADRERVRRAAARAKREETTLAMLADRLPDYEPRVTFPKLWQDVKHIRGILGRDGLYDLLTRLDGAHLNEDLLVRIAHHERASRRVVVVRPRRSWDEQRAYLERFVRRGHVRPPHPVSYATAHARIAAERGRASSFSCVGCGVNRAAEWSYRGSSPDEQVGWVTSYDEDGVPLRSLRLWSPSPEDYEPLCRSCHVELDGSGILWGDAPRTLKLKPSTPLPSEPLPAEAPDWVRALVEPHA